MTTQFPREPGPYEHGATYGTPVTGHDHTHRDGHDGHTDHDGHEGHGGHRWMMIACCIPMLIVVGALIATGVAGTGAIIYAAVCLAAMALMMRLMPGDHH